MPVSSLEHKVIHTLACLMKNEVFQYYANVIKSGHRPPVGGTGQNPLHHLLFTLTLCFSKDATVWGKHVFYKQRFTHWKLKRWDISQDLQILCFQNFAVRFSIKSASFTIYCMTTELHTLPIYFDVSVPKSEECLFKGKQV